MGISRHVLVAILKPKEEEMDRRVFWLAEDHYAAAQSPAIAESLKVLGVRLCVCRLQLSAHAQSCRRGCDWVSQGQSLSG